MAKKSKLDDTPVTSGNVWNDQECDYLLERWLRSLRSENERTRQGAVASSAQVTASSARNTASSAQVTAASSAQSVCRSIIGRLLAFLTLASKTLHLGSPVKYTALDLYCRFITRHIESMTKYAEDNSEPGERGKACGTGSRRGTDPQNEDRAAVDCLQEREDLMERLVERLAEQTPLRLLSCLQLASKLHSHSHNLTIPKLRGLLRRVGQDYSARAVVRSETRVLTTLDHRCSCQSSYLDYIDSLVVRLKLSFGCRKRTEHSQVRIGDSAKSSRRRCCSSGDDDEEISVTKRQLENQPADEESLRPSKSHRKLKTNDKTLIKRSKRTDQAVISGTTSTATSSKRASECRISSETASKALKPNDYPSPQGLPTENGTQDSGGDAELAAILFANMDTLRKTAILLLDAALVHYEQLYAALLLHITGSDHLPPEFSEAYARVECDRLLLCCSLVHAAAGLIGGSAYTAAVGPTLARHAGLSLTDICTFSRVITSVLLLDSQL